jgi:hypothetical protein
MKRKASPIKNKSPMSALEAVAAAFTCFEEAEDVESESESVNTGQLVAVIKEQCKPRDSTA